MNRQEFEAKVIAKAWRDAAFREKLEKDPKATIAEELSAVKGATITLPDNFKVSVVHETPDQMYLVIPPNPEDVHSVKLSDEQLLAVAGGAGQTAVNAVAVTQISGPTLDTVAVVQVVDTGQVVVTSVAVVLVA